jgi:hypothetical protein
MICRLSSDLLVSMMKMNLKFPFIPYSIHDVFSTSITISLKIVRILAIGIKKGRNDYALLNFTMIRLSYSLRCIADCLCPKTEDDDVGQEARYSADMQV